MIFVDRSSVPPPQELSIFHEKELDRLRQVFESGDSWHAQRRPDFLLPPTLNRQVRATLQAIFQGKCAFCERPGSTIERFRPKWRASRLDRQIDIDRYWWLANDWHNLYLCCQECNVRKANAFPIAGEPAKPYTVGDDLKLEQPLLLDPCDDLPEEHLRFMASGEVVPLTHRGEVTIRIFELNNPYLVKSRRDIARLALHVCEQSWSTEFATSRDLERFRHHASALLGSTAHVAVIRATVQNFLRDRVSMPEALEVPPNLPPAQFELPKPVWLDTIEIRNFKSIDALDLTFPKLDEYSSESSLGDEATEEVLGEPVGQPWLMVLGENGVGKSSVLQAIALALMPDAERDALGRAHLWLRRHEGVGEGHIRLVFSDGSERILRFQKKAKLFTVEGEVPLMSVLAYGSTRLLPRRSRKLDQPATVSVRNLFDHTHPLSNTERFLCDKNVVLEQHFQLLAGSLKSLLPISEDTELKRKQTHLSARVAGREVTLSELSDGYKSMLALAMDIMFHLSGSSFDMESACGLVMVDELELHLHPRWKVAIVRQLRTLFPNVRFVVSTHDPLCVLGLRSKELYVLAVDPTTQGIVRDRIDVPKGTRADEVLTGPWFGVASTIDADTQLLMDEHSKLLQRVDLRNEDHARRIYLEDVLRKRLGSFATTRAQRAVLAAAAVLNPGRSVTHLDHVLQHRLRRLLERGAGYPGEEGHA